MAILRLLAAGAAAGLWATLSGCGDLEGLSATPSPLARVAIEITGELTPLRPAGSENDPVRLRVALAWGAQWLPEPFCILPAESPEAAAVIAAGCRDPFGFVPSRVATSAPIGEGGRAILDLYDLPTADQMVGDVSARIAYGSLIVFDDRDDSGTLELGRSGFGLGDNPDADGGGIGTPFLSSQDIIYGASLVSMTLPDQRLVLREGGFDENAAFYPRRGCAPPRPGFSIVGSGGFSAEAAIRATLMGRLPEQDPALCTDAPVSGTTILIALSPPAEVSEVGCFGRRSSGFTRYREPPDEVPPDFDSRAWACVGLPDLGAITGADPPSDVRQLVIADPARFGCNGLAHYVLSGCDNDAECERPEWSRMPPDWWPCGP